MMKHDGEQAGVDSAGSQEALLPVSPTPLSSAGVARKQAMLGELQSLVRRQGIRRRVVRATIPACAVVLLGATGFILLQTLRLARIDPTRPSVPASELAMQASEPDRGDNNPLPVDVPTSVPTYTAIHVLTPPAKSTIRLAVSTSTNVVSITRTIGDDELVALLASTGRDCGLVRTRNRTTVLCNSCEEGDELFKPGSHHGEHADSKHGAGI